MGTALRGGKAVIVFTRGLSGPMIHQYTPQPPQRVAVPGLMRRETVNGIELTWVIARPMTCFEGSNAPFYYQEDQSDCGTDIARGGVMRLTPSRPRVQMDPSNPKTWQRQYRF